MSIFKEPLNQSATLTALPEGEPRDSADLVNSSINCEL